MSLKIILILFNVYLNYLNLHFLVTTTHTNPSQTSSSYIILDCRLSRLNLGQSFQQNGTASEAVRRLQLVGDPIDANEAQRPCPRSPRSPRTWVNGCEWHPECVENGFTMFHSLLHSTYSTFILKLPFLARCLCL